MALDPAGIQRGDLGGRPSPATSNSSFLLSHSHSQGSLSLLQQPAVAGLEWRRMEKRWGLQPDAQGFRPPSWAGCGRQNLALFIQATLFRSRWAPVNAASQELG